MPLGNPAQHIAAVGIVRNHRADGQIVIPNRTQNDQIAFFHGRVHGFGLCRRRLPVEVSRNPVSEQQGFRNQKHAAEHQHRDDQIQNSLQKPQETVSRSRMCFFHSVLSFQQKQKPLGRKVRATGSKRRTSVRHSNRSVGQPAVIAQRATDPSGFVSRPFGRFTDIPFFSDAYKRALRHVFFSMSQSAHFDLCTCVDLLFAGTAKSPVHGVRIIHTDRF